MMTIMNGSGRWRDLDGGSDYSVCGPADYVLCLFIHSICL
jgi:hypothetical protein